MQNITTRDKVLATLKEQWEVPTPREEGRRVDSGQVETLARQALDIMLTRPFRVGKFPAGEDYDQILSRVRYWMTRGKSIRITMGYAPMKNPRNVPYWHADWAEFFALGHLCAWHNKVCAVYPPGLRIKIIFDDATAAMANRVDPRIMTGYIRSVGRLIRRMGYQSFIVGTMRQSWFAWLFHFGPYQFARPRVRRWEADPANQPVMETMAEFARRNLDLPEDLATEEKERRCREASHRFRVYWEALQLSGFSRLGHSLVGMYLDGSQHHIRQTAALHLRVYKDQLTQPWQGEGVLADNGHGLLLPLVLTPSRRERMVTEQYDGLELVPLEGFDHISVCREVKE